MKKKRILYSLLVMIIASFVLPFVLGAWYAIPSADDFTNTISYLDDKQGLLGYLLHNLINLYMSWQGTYTGVFLTGIPVYYLWGISGIRVECVIATIVFFISLSFLVYQIIKMYCSEENRTGLALLCEIVVLFLLFYADRVSELFFWHTGIMVYTVPLILTFITIWRYLVISNHENTKGDSRKQIVITSIIAFLAAGGSLQISALLCSVLMYLVVGEWISSKRWAAKYWIFVISVMGALVNAAAPGNFARHSYNSNGESKLHIIKAGMYTLLKVNRWLFDNNAINVFVLGMVIFFILGFWFSNKERGINLVYSIVGSILGVFITNFPVPLGYEGIYFPDRCEFVLNLSLIFYMAVAAFSIGKYFGINCKEGYYKRLLTSTLLIVSISMNVSLLSIDWMAGFTPYRMIRGVIAGDYNEVANNQIRILHEIETAGESKVVVYTNAEVEGKKTDLKLVGLTSDENSWINRDVAKYYGKESIVLLYE